MSGDSTSPREYGSADSNAELGGLADAAKGAADRAGADIDDALDFIEASNKRIAAMEESEANPALKETA